MSPAAAPRLCLFCRRSLMQHSAERVDNFKRRQFCSETCRRKHFSAMYWKGKREAPPPKQSKGPKTDNPQVWLQYNKITKCEPAYAEGAYTFAAYYQSRQTVFRARRSS